MWNIVVFGFPFFSFLCASLLYPFVPCLSCDRVFFRLSFLALALALTVLSFLALTLTFLTFSTLPNFVLPMSYLRAGTYPGSATWLVHFYIGLAYVGLCCTCLGVRRGDMARLARSGFLAP